MPDGSAAEVKRGRKFDQVLKGARDIFMSDGYEGASVDAIARAAGVSKATLYSYFPEKQLLFLEVARAECLRQAETATATIDTTQAPCEVLRKVARQALDFITSDFGQRMFRISVAESDRFPELGRAFYESGPKMGRDRLRDYFEEAMERGELAMDDPELAADQFNELCKADIFPRLVFNVQRSFDQSEKDRIADGAVETFLARYGT